MIPPVSAVVSEEVHGISLSKVDEAAVDKNGDDDQHQQQTKLFVSLTQQT